MSRTLQVFVIGQSPRLDIEAQVALVARDAKISVEGVLDGMSLEQIADRVVPESDRDAVFATLSSGDTVTVSKQMVTTRLSAKLETGGPALLWSTASFQDLPRRHDFVQPAELLTMMIDVLLPTGTLGLIVPRRRQLDMQTKERSRPGLHVVAAALAPRSDHAAVDAAAFQLVAQKPDLAIMDCMSYTRLEMARVSATLSCLVLLPAVAATQAAAALLAMDRMESSVRHSLSDHGPKPGR
jgi:protein AroM